MASVSKRAWTYKGEKKEAWVVRYLDGDHHRSKQFEKKKEADDFRRKVERETDDGIHVADRATISVGELATQFVEAEELRFSDGRVSRGHLRNVRMVVKVSVVPFIGKKTVRDLKANDIEDWYRRMVQEGGLSPATAKYRIQFCNPMFTHAVQRGYAKANPLKDGVARLRGIKKQPIRTFSVEEVGAILRAANQRRPKGRDRTFLITRLFINLAAFCGLRYGEIAGLTLQRVNFATRFIEVRHSLSEWDELKAPKTKAGLRDVPMPEHIEKMLREWIVGQYVANDRGLLFRVHEERISHKPAGFILPANFRQAYWRPVLERAGIPIDDGLPHFHALRHFAASWMIANGMPIVDVARLLGHQEFDMTLQVYAHGVTTAAQRTQAFDSMATRLLSAPVLDLKASAIAQELRNAG